MNSTLLITLCFVGVLCTVPVSSQAPNAAPKSQIDWGKCPQLQPSETDLKSKSNVLMNCLKEFPIPALFEVKTITEHQKNITGCALRSEKWFNDDGSYKFEKAEKEIRSKKLVKEMEDSLVLAHGQCKKEANEHLLKNKVDMVDLVQFYQGCMDAQITALCEIKIERPPQPLAQ